MTISQHSTETFGLTPTRLRRTWALRAALAAAGALALPVQAAPPVIHTADVDRFFLVYEAAGGKPSAEVLQRDYLDPSSEGLKTFARLRRVTAERIADAIAKEPATYANARRCAAHLPRATARLSAALTKLRRAYPQTTEAPIYIVIGRGRPVGVGDASGAYVGLEALCAWTTPNPDEEDRLVYVLTHEYVHVQQSSANPKLDETTVLGAALVEGTAEFLTELTAGAVAYQHLSKLAAGREAEFEAGFLDDIDTKAEGSRWVYNGQGTAERPGDLGYWVGYRIAKAYYLRAKDKRAAVRELIALRDPKAILAESGWRPGLRLPARVAAP